MNNQNYVKQGAAALWTKSFVTLTIASFLLFLNLQMLLSSFSIHIKGNLGGEDLDVSLAVSVFALTAIVARLLTSKWIRSFSRDGVLTVGIIITIASTILSALPDTVTPLLVMRALYGIGFGIGSTIIPTLVSQIIPQSRMGEGIGYFGLSTSLAMSIGPSIGMGLMKGPGFTVLAAAGAAAVVCMVPMLLTSGAYRISWNTFVPASKLAKRQAKLEAGQAVASEQEDSLSSAKVKASERETSMQTGAENVKVSDLESEVQTNEVQIEVIEKAGRLSSAKAEASMKTGAEKSKVSGLETSEDKLKVSSSAVGQTASGASKSKLWIPPVWFPALMNALLSVTYSGILSFIAVYGEQLNLANVGLFFLFNAMTVLIVRPISGKIFDRKGPNLVLIPAACFVIASLIVLSYTMNMTTLIISALLYGAGFGSIQPTLQAWMLRSVVKEHYGTVNGIYYNSTDVGVSLGAIVLGVIATMSSYEMMYRLSSLLMVLFVLAVVIYVRVEKKRRAGSEI